MTYAEGLREGRQEAARCIENWIKLVESGALNGVPTPVEFHYRDLWRFVTSWPERLREDL